MATPAGKNYLAETPLNHPYTITLDDDPLVSKLIQGALGIRNLSFADSSQLLEQSHQWAPQAVFIDIHLPDGSGLSVIPTLRKLWPFIPFIVITADKNESLISEALSLGADDFIQKPIKTTELKARLHKRWQDTREKQSTSVLKFEDITLDSGHALLTGPKNNRNLSPTENHLLVRLIQAQGTAVSRSELKNSCWQQVSVTENALDRKIYETRKALVDVGSRLQIQTIYGEGFLLRLLGTTK